MKYLLLFISLMACAPANAKIIIPDCPDAENVSISSLAPADKLTLAPPRRYANDGSRVNFMYDLFGSDFISRFSQTGYKGGGALNWGAEIGMTIKLNARNPGATNLINVGVYGMQLSLLQKTTDPVTGNKKSDRQNLSVFGVPVTFGKLGGGDGAGFYYEIGAVFSHVFSATLSGRDIAKNFNSIYVEPFLGVGLSTPFRIINRRSGDEHGHGKVMLGPFYTDVVTNMSAVSGVKVHGHSFGIMWRYRFE
jgi:hypothetical protein